MSRSAPDLEGLHPSLWRAHQLGHAAVAVVPTGYAVLDAQLPGGGWPCGALTELLLPHPGVGEMRLLAPGLATVANPGRPLMCFDPPARLCAQALAQLGIDTQQLIVVHGHGGPVDPVLRHRLGASDLLWALEQTLRSGSAGAVLAWLPDALRSDALRRLHGAAQAAASRPVFILRGASARLESSPAMLRLLLHPVTAPDELALHLIKRRGPPMAEPLRLSLSPVLTPTQQVRTHARTRTLLPAPASGQISDLWASG